MISGFSWMHKGLGAPCVAPSLGSPVYLCSYRDKGRRLIYKLQVKC